MYGEQARFFEMEKTPPLKHKKLGTLSMVNNGSDMFGSQFLITTSDDLDYLDGKHVVFGEVSEGFETLTKINEAFCDDEHRPFRDIRIFHTVVLDDPYPDPPQLHPPSRSPSPVARETLDIVRIGVDEKIDDMEGMSKEEVEALIKEKEAKANAQILEMVGDLPDADVAPPENVLFVCKLNPVTSSKDLEIIFSRFGNIVECEVIRDHQSGESLQYAFIEFEKEEDCERAYFKMDNVLIDDRRIHVDFSQSVAKVKWQKFKQQKNKKLGIEGGSRQRSVSRSPSREKRRDDRYFQQRDRRSRSRSRDRRDRDEYRDKASRKDRRNRSRSSSRSRKDDYRRSRSRSRDRYRHERRRSRSRDRHHSSKKYHRR